MSYLIKYILIALLIINCESFKLSNIKGNKLKLYNTNIDGYGDIPKSVKKYFNDQKLKKSEKKTNYPIIGEEEIMCQKMNGSCGDNNDVKLRWGGDKELSINICCFNRYYAEPSGYWKSKSFINELNKNISITFYDTITKKQLFKIPNSRSINDFISETEKHGWPSFRDDEVSWENVRCLKNGETVSIDGTHLGHNIPDEKGNRYCINILSISG